MYVCVPRSAASASKFSLSLFIVWDITYTIVYLMNGMAPRATTKLAFVFVNFSQHNPF